MASMKSEIVRFDCGTPEVGGMLFSCSSMIESYQSHACLTKPHNVFTQVEVDHEVPDALLEFEPSERPAPWIAGKCWFLLRV